MSLTVYFIAQSKSVRADNRQKQRDLFPERKNSDGLNQVLKNPQGDWGPKGVAVQNSPDSTLGLWPAIGRQAPAHEPRLESLEPRGLACLLA